MVTTPLPTLKKTQALLWQLITAPENVTEAPPFIEEGALLSAVDRVNIYANMYFFRILDALKEDFPLLLQKLGDDEFHNLITDYLQAHPPTHYSLRYAGQHLADFVIARARSARGNPECSNGIATPSARDDTLTELARFEWALVTAYDAADAPPLTEDDLKKIPADQWPQLQLRLHPSVQLLEHPHQIVWRQGLDVVHRAADREEWELLNHIFRGDVFAVLCETTAPALILNHLRTWVSQGLLA